eukprot:5070185-Amphidinium_carterae.1
MTSSLALKAMSHEQLPSKLTVLSNTFARLVISPKPWEPLSEVFRLPSPCSDTTGRANSHTYSEACRLMRRASWWADCSMLYGMHWSWLWGSPIFDHVWPSYARKICTPPVSQGGMGVVDLPLHAILYIIWYVAPRAWRLCPSPHAQPRSYATMLHGNMRSSCLP